MDDKSSAIPEEETTEPTTTETTEPTQAEMEKTMPAKTTIETEEELDSLIGGEDFNQYKEYLEEKYKTPRKLTQYRPWEEGKQLINESKEAEAGRSRPRRLGRSRSLKRKIDVADPWNPRGDENKIPDSVAHLFPGKKVGTIDNKRERETP